MKLALNGQWKDISGLIYTYPEQSSGIPEWAVSLPDAREVREYINGDYCFTLWYNNNGYYFACTKTRTDSRNGCVMLALCMGAKVPSNGKLFAEKMRSLLDFCLSKNDVSDIALVDISLKINDLEELLTHRDLPHDGASLPSNELKLSYRLYKSEDELGLILENPNQPSYYGFDRILVIDESSFKGESAGTQVLRITDSILKTYDIRTDSNDITANKDSVMDGDKFTITYRKIGFVEEKVDVIAGGPSTYYSIDGNVINLKPASVVGINFMKEIILQVVDEETKSPIKKWSCKIDGSIKNDAKVENTDGSISYRIDPNRPHKIVFFADGYEDKTLELAAGEHGLKTVRLHSSDDSVFVRLQLGKEEYSGSVRMKSNNKLYYPLKRLNEKNKVLQVKRGFFSRRNLVPILVLFLASLLLGGAIGKFVIKDNEPSVPNTPTVDSAIYNTLKKEYETIKKDLNTTKIEIDSYKKAYGKILKSVKDKISQNPDKVVKVLIKNDALLDGNETDLNVLDEIQNELNSIQKANNSGNNSGGTGNGGTGGTGGSTNSIEQIEQLLQNDVWNLESISSISNAGSNFVKKITDTQKQDLNTLLNGNGLYKTARDKNQTWQQILNQANSLSSRDKSDFFNYMNAYPQMENNKLDLNKVATFFNRK